MMSAVLTIRGECLVKHDSPHPRRRPGRRSGGARAGRAVLRYRGRLRRLIGGLHDLCTARAREPHIAIVAPTVEFTASLVFSDEYRKGLEGFSPRHGAPPWEALLPLLRGRRARV